MKYKMLVTMKNGKEYELHTNKNINDVLDTIRQRTKKDMFVHGEYRGRTIILRASDISSLEVLDG